jgi:hypothetical protein
MKTIQKMMIDCFLFCVLLLFFTRDLTFLVIMVTCLVVGVIIEAMLEKSETTHSTSSSTSVYDGYCGDSADYRTHVEQTDVEDRVRKFNKAHKNTR